MAGNVDYDYLLASPPWTAASRQGDLAFERVLAVNPNFAGARLDMARAYFALGIMNGRKRVETVLGQNRHPGQATIEKVPGAISNRTRRPWSPAT